MYVLNRMAMHWVKMLICLGFGILDLQAIQIKTGRSPLI